METLTCRLDRGQERESTPSVFPAHAAARTFESTMADSSQTDRLRSRPNSDSKSAGRKGPSATDLMTEELEASISSTVKRKIDSIVADVNKFNDLEKLLLYLKLPMGINGHSSSHLKSTSPSLTVTRVEQTQAFNWIRSHIEECTDTSLPKHEVYEDYRTHCDSACRRVLSPADFGKIMKNVFPDVKARRLGTRGKARYCYSGLRKKFDIQPPSLPQMESPRKIGPNDLLHRSSPCKCSAEQQQADLANTLVISQWAEKIFATRFQTTDDLAYYLASNKLVSNSLASYTVLSSRRENSSSSTRSLRLDAGMAKPPITPEERHKETQHQLQKKIQQRQLSKMREEQNRQSQSLAQERKLLNRSHSMPNEMQMNARVDSQVGGARDQEGLLSNGQNGCRQGDQQANTMVQTNSNSNNNSHQVPAVVSTSTAAAAAATIKESPNKPRYQPIQPKTPVRDSAVKMSRPVNSAQVVLVQPSIVNASGQKIHQLPQSVQLVPIPSRLPNGSGPQLTTIPVQNIPNAKLVATGSSKAATPLPANSIMVLSPGQVLKGSSVSAGLLVLNHSPSAGLSANIMGGSVPASSAAKVQKDISKTLPSQRNSQMLHLQLDAGASPQGGTSANNSGIVPLNTLVAHPQSNPDISSLHSLPLQSLNCSTSSTVLINSQDLGLQKTPPHTHTQQASVVNQAAVGTPSKTSQSQSTSVTFSTLTMQKQTSESQASTSTPASSEFNMFSLSTGLASGSNSHVPVSMENSASTLLAILSNTATKEQGLYDGRGAGRASQITSHSGSTTQGLPPGSFVMSETASTSSTPLDNRSSNSVVSVPGVGLKTLTDTRVARMPCSSGGFQNGLLTLPATPIRTQTNLQASNSSLLSMLSAPAIETPPSGQVQPVHQQHLQEGKQSTLPSDKALPRSSFPIYTGNQQVNLITQHVEVPVAIDIGNKKLALSSAQFIDPSNIVSLQAGTILSQIREVASDLDEATNRKALIKREMEKFASQSVQQGIVSPQPVSFVGRIGQCLPPSSIQQSTGSDNQGRQSITPSYNNPHSNTATPIQMGVDSIPLSPSDSQVFFTFTPIQQGTDQVGVTSHNLVRPMQKPKAKLGAVPANFATPSRKRRGSGATRRPGFNGCLPPSVSRQATPTPSPNGSRCSTPLSPSMVSANSQSDSASMPPPSPAMIPSDVSQPTSSRVPSSSPCFQNPNQSLWGPNAMLNRRRNPSGPATLMQPTKELSTDASSFLPDELTDLNMQASNPALEFSTAQQQFQRSHSVPLPAYHPFVLSQDRLISSFPVPSNQRGITTNNRNFAAKRNLTQELQEIEVTDEDFNPEENFLSEGNDTSFNDILHADLQQPSQDQGSWVGDPSLGGIPPADLNVDFPINSCSSQEDTDNELGLGQGLGDNSNSTASTLNEEIAAMDDMDSSPVFTDFSLPSWQQIGSNGNLTTLECSM